MVGAGCAWRGGQSKDVFGEKEDANDSEPKVELGCPVLPPNVRRVREHNADAGSEQRVMRATKYSAGGARALRIKKPVEPFASHIPF